MSDVIQTSTPQQIRQEQRAKRWKDALARTPTAAMPEHEQKAQQALAALSLQPGWDELQTLLAKYAAPQSLDLTSPNWAAQLAVERTKIEMAAWIIRVVDTAAVRVAAAAQPKE